jgi:inosose dehydratase
MPQPAPTVDISRVAGAPISWGVCEVPGWGHQLDADRVLREMRDLGLTATEFGPDGFLPAAANERRRVLGAAGLRALGGFVPVVLFDEAQDPLPVVEAFLDDALAVGADVLVLAAATGQDGYDTRPELSEAQWGVLLANLDRIAARATERGAIATLHPHVGTIVETGAEVDRVLSGSGIALTLDTGHLLVGGSDPVALARRAPERVAHVHLKDVSAPVAAEVAAGRLSYSEAVRNDLYRPLGRGDVDVAALVAALEGAGYQGWYVLEQDVMLDEEPVGEGPVADVRASLDHLLGLGR